MAAGSTYTPIATTTLSSAVSSYTFTSIPSTYTDLVLIGNFGTTVAGNSTRIQVGSGSINTGGEYSYVFTYGTGSSAVSTQYGRDTSIYAGYCSTANLQNNWVVNFQNYSNTTTKKLIHQRFNNASGSVVTVLGLYHAAGFAAINQIRVLTLGDNLLAGSTFTLYGIAAA
jgi:hypothetical protein